MSDLKHLVQKALDRNKREAQAPNALRRADRLPGQDKTRTTPVWSDPSNPPPPPTAA